MKIFHIILGLWFKLRWLGPTPYSLQWIKKLGDGEENEIRKKLQFPFLAA